MRVLVACECSGVVRDAFNKKGHRAKSCDLKDTEKPGDHYKGNVFDIIEEGWDLMIAHPPCTYLTVTGNRWMSPKYKHRFPDREKKRKQAIEFFMALYNAPIPKIAIENPIGIMSTEFRPPDQIIQPYYFGDEARKATCLWLKNLNKLYHQEEDDLFSKKTHVGQGEIVKYKSGKTFSKWYVETSKLPVNERAAARSVTFQGIADAMADQWG